MTPLYCLKNRCRKGKRY